MPERGFSQRQSQGLTSERSKENTDPKSKGTGASRRTEETHLSAEKPPPKGPSEKGIPFHLVAWRAEGRTLGSRRWCAEVLDALGHLGADLLALTEMGVEGEQQRSRAQRAWGHWGVSGSGEGAWLC